MRRYKFLTEKDVNEALNRLRDAFLAAKNGEEVNIIIKGLLTPEERIQIGRRIIISECIKGNLTQEEISRIMKVGKATINSVYKNMLLFPGCFKLINNRKQKVEKEYRLKKYNEIGGSMLVVKRKEYSGFKRKNVKR